MDDSINVEVLYALPHHQVLCRVALPMGGTVHDAIRLSGILAGYPEIDLSRNKLGIYGKLASADAVLRDRDRVEIYRPLLADPKEVRRQRAERSRAVKKGGRA